MFRFYTVSSPSVNQYLGAYDYRAEVREQSAFWMMVDALGWAILDSFLLRLPLVSGQIYRFGSWFIRKADEHEELIVKIDLTEEQYQALHPYGFEDDDDL